MVWLRKSKKLSYKPRSNWQSRCVCRPTPTSLDLLLLLVSKKRCDFTRRVSMRIPRLCSPLEASTRRVSSMKASIVVVSLESARQSKPSLSPTSKRRSSIMTKHLTLNPMPRSSWVTSWRTGYTKMGIGGSRTWLGRLPSIVRLRIRRMDVERLCTSKESSTTKASVSRRTYSRRSESMMSRKLKATFSQWTHLAPYSTMSYMITFRLRNGSRKLPRKDAQEHSTT